MRDLMPDELGETDVIKTEIKCTLNVMHLKNHTSILVHGKIVFHETHPWCQEGRGLLT